VWSKAEGANGFAPKNGPHGSDNIGRRGILQQVTCHARPGGGQELLIVEFHPDEDDPQSSFPFAAMSKICLQPR